MKEIISSPGDVATAWILLTATDGTGGYIGGNLVNSATRILNDSEVSSYNIDWLPMKPRFIEGDRYEQYMEILY